MSGFQQSSGLVYSVSFWPVRDPVTKNKGEAGEKARGKRTFAVQT